ncbi:hypothetical protein AHF37_07631 [Paragonimus kellicotti]|nr:hypothetical protein AHF37_07631 [Paragonimus kellicotti]
MAYQSDTRETCLIFQELEEARTTLEHVQQILEEVERIPRQCASVAQGAGGRTAYQPAPLKNTCGKREEHMSSKEWLERHSLKSQHLGLYETLAHVSFKHCDGVVDLLKPPTSELSLNVDELLYTDDRHSQYSNTEGKHRERNYSSESSQPAAIVHPKLINARYCDEFVHVLWKDGSLVHVQVTPQLYQLYSRRVKATLTAIQRRIDWLCEGSRELFGTITEDEASFFVQFVCVLIDTSTSMLPCLEFLKRKLLTLVQEQLKQKSRVNFVAFGSTVKPWSHSPRTTTESNLNASFYRLTFFDPYRFDVWLKLYVCIDTVNASIL